jgi:hypothetical protein
MNGGKILGRGAKGQVMDYGSENDPLSFEHTVFEQVDHVILHVVDKDKIKQIRKGPAVLSDLQRKDRSCTYAVKEFIPKLLYSIQGLTPHESMMNEIHAIQHLLPLVIQRHIIGIPYQKSLLIGLEIIMAQQTRCFMFQHKCTPLPSIQPRTFPIFVKKILSELIVLQELNIAHNDIKFDNIMMYKGKYEFIDWESATPLDYSFLKKVAFIHKHPVYYKMRYGDAWYPAFYVAIATYDKYQLPQYHEYVRVVTAHYSNLFEIHTTQEVFEQCKYEFDLFKFGLMLYIIIQQTPLLKKYKPFVMNLFKMKNAKEALRQFQSKGTRKRKNIVS